MCVHAHVVDYIVWINDVYICVYLMGYSRKPSVHLI